MAESRRTTRVTIIDVARAAGVSRQTVSNVVNTPHIVAPATRAAVEQHIERLGYRASRAASSLRRETAGAWGFELDTFGSRRMGNVLDTFLIELTDRAARVHTHVMPFVSEPAKSIDTYRELIQGRHVDGFVLANTAYDDPRPGWLTAEDVPYAAFGRIWDDPSNERWVDVDGAAGVRAAVTHLREVGYERIGFLGWPEGSLVGADRRSGWAELVGDDQPSAMSEQDIASATVAAADLVERLGIGAAVVCASDVLAIGVWRHLTEVGLRPGRDVGLVGFDDTDMAEALGLSSVAQPLDVVAECTFELLAGRASSSFLLEPRLIVRASSTPNLQSQAPARPADRTATLHRGIS